MEILITLFIIPVVLSAMAITLDSTPKIFVLYLGYIVAAWTVSNIYVHGFNITSDSISFEIVIYIVLGAHGFLVLKTGSKSRGSIIYRLKNIGWPAWKLWFSNIHKLVASIAFLVFAVLGTFAEMTTYLRSELHWLPSKDFTAGERFVILVTECFSEAADVGSLAGSELIDTFKEMEWR